MPERETKKKKAREKSVVRSSLKNAGKSLAEKIKTASQGLYYISETDAEISLFVGTKAAANSKEEILRQTGNAPDAPIEERNFDEIFARLTSIEDWFGEEETATAARFAVLRDLLKNNLKDLRVFKIGKIRIDVYFVGTDANGILTGIKTQAVET